MALYKHTDGKLLYVGGELAKSQDCCCSNCDGTTVTGCCLTEITPVLPPPNPGGATTRTVTCEASTECACDLLEGVTVTTCGSIDCCLDGFCFTSNSCDCLNVGGTIVADCAECLPWEPGDPPNPPPNDLPGDTGTGGAGPGPCGANPPAANDCVYCRLAIKESGTGSDTNTSTYGSIIRRSQCQANIASALATSSITYYPNDPPQYNSYLLYASITELTCTVGSTVFYYSNGIEFNYGGSITSYPDGKYPYTCSCTCPP